LSPEDAATTLRLLQEILTQLEAVWHALGAIAFLGLIFIASIFFAAAWSVRNVNRRQEELQHSVRDVNRRQEELQHKYNGVLEILLHNAKESAKHRHHQQQ
jgi:hypothetical protein